MNIKEGLGQKAIVPSSFLKQIRNVKRLISNFQYNMKNIRKDDA